MSRPVFFVKRGDRLIARLKHLLYAWRFARQCDGQVIVVWREPHKVFQQFDGTNYSPSLIFDLGSFYRQGGAQSVVFLEHNLIYPNDAPSLQDSEFSGMRNNNFDREYFKQSGLVFYEKILMRYHFADEKPLIQTVNSELAELFGKLPLSPPVTKLYDQARARLGDGFVALHVRRGDIYERLRQARARFCDGNLTQADIDMLGHYVARTAPLEMYLPHVQAVVEKGRKIAFFSDSPETYDWFVKRIGAGNIVDGSQFTARFPIQKAMLDFVIMCTASQVISTRSNYASLATEIGGIEHVIVSAQNYCGMPADKVIALYLKEAHNEFATQTPLTSLTQSIIEAEIRRMYLSLNGLAPTVGPGG